MSIDAANSDINSASAVKASGRLFTAYGRYCDLTNAETLFNFLAALHSLNDRLKSSIGRDFLGIEEFVALKAIRNFAHHHDEISANVCIVTNVGTSDLAVLCIVRRDQVERAIAQVDPRWRTKTKAACHSKFHWYGEAININPCIFNFMVHAYETMAEMELEIPPDSVASFEESYRFEENEGYSHFIDGRLIGNFEELSRIYSRIVATLPPP